MSDTTIAPADAVRTLWRAGGLDEAMLDTLDLSGRDPVLASSFAVGTAAQASLAVAALAASAIGRERNGVEQRVGVDMGEAAIECCVPFTIDAKVPELWDPIAGLYPCADGWVRLHTNFAHHRDATLAVLGLPAGPTTERAAVAAALQGWRAVDFEDAAARARIVGAALRDDDAWQRHPQRAALLADPLVGITRLGDADPSPWPALAPDARPLEGLRVLDLTRILAGPVAARTLAAYGADVLMVNSPSLPNIAAIADLSRGKRSALADLRIDADRAAFASVVGEAHVLLQGYRPGGLAALGFGPDEVAARRPGIVYATLSAYGPRGPWAERRGFDSLVQAATGINVAEGRAAGSDQPRALPMQALDLCAGFLLAWGIEQALLRQRREGGSWHVEVSLARTGEWLRSLGRVEGGFAVAKPDVEPMLETSASDFGTLRAARHAARFSRTPAAYTRPSRKPGADRLAWT